MVACAPSIYEVLGSILSISTKNKYIKGEKRKKRQDLSMIKSQALEPESLGPYPTTTSHVTLGKSLRASVFNDMGITAPTCHVVLARTK